uniref:Zgc:153704 n=1 Tax=Gadus morhua TaxID=8049 RepID=A0A8C4YXF9_GADMO
GISMATALFSVLGILLCSLLVTSDVVPQDNFNIQAVAGKWYLIGFATNAQWFVDHRASMKMGTAILTPTAAGDLDMSYASLRSDASCWRMSHLAKKTDVPGKFVFKSERMDNDNDMRVVDVKYDEYALIYTLKTNGGVSTVLNKLYGRGNQLNPQLLEKFKQFSLENGILPENIAILPQNDYRCPLTHIYNGIFT